MMATDGPPSQVPLSTGQGKSKHWMGDWKTSMAAPASAAATWGPYFDAEFGPPQRVRAWIAWKISSTGVNIARRWWGSARGARRGVNPRRFVVVKQ